MKGKRTQAERSASTRDALVRAARPLFAEHGYAAVGTEAIVRAAGVTRGAMYHQFADKVELFAAVFETVEAEVMAGLDAAVAAGAGDDLMATMKLGARAWLEACADPEAHRILLVDAPAVLGWERWRAVGQRYGLGLIESLLGQAVQIGGDHRAAGGPAGPRATRRARRGRALRRPGRRSGPGPRRGHRRPRPDAGRLGRRLMPARAYSWAR